MDRRDIEGLFIQHHAVMFDPGRGWALNTHKQYPYAPRSPFYIDLRACIRSAPIFRRKLARCMEDFIWGIQGGDPFPLYADLISDAPQAITPLVALLSDMTSIPMISPRLNAKAYGLENEIDGFWQPGQSVIIIDDVRTSGRTLQDINDLYRRHGLVVNACVTVIDRSAEGNPYIGDVPCFDRFRWNELLPRYRDQHVITPELYERCVRYPAELEQYVRTHSAEADRAQAL